jgi:hypothetical protein
MSFGGIMVEGNRAMQVYARSKHASAIDLEDGSVLVRCCVEDTFFAADVELVVKIPELEIVSAKGDIKRAFQDECLQAVGLLQRVEGLNIATGLIKNVNGLVGGSGGCHRLADLVLEACDEVILRFTADGLRKVLELDVLDRPELLKEHARNNPRMIGSCIAFAKESSLLEGVEL